MQATSVRHASSLGRGRGRRGGSRRGLRGSHRMLFGLAATKRKREATRTSQQHILGELGTMRIVENIAPRKRATSPSNQKKASNRGNNSEPRRQRFGHPQFQCGANQTFFGSTVSSNIHLNTEITIFKTAYARRTAFPHRQHFFFGSAARKVGPEKIFGAGGNSQNASAKRSFVSRDVKMAGGSPCDDSNANFCRH